MDNRKLAPSEKNNVSTEKKLNQSLLSSTAAALQSFKSALKPRVHSDGIGIGSLDFRLRHIPANLAYLSQHYSQEVMTAVIMLLKLSEAEARSPKSKGNPWETIDFVDGNHTTNYAISTSLRLISIIEKIKASVCNVTVSLDHASKYDLIKKWGSEVYLWRSKNSSVLNNVETCLENMIQSDINALTQKEQHDFNIKLGFSLGIAGGVLLLCLIITLIYLFPRRSLNTNISTSFIQLDAEETNDNEEETVENTSRALPTTTISPTLAAKLKEIEESGPKHHFEERLKKIGYDLNKVPEDFLDPVFYFIMDNPVVVRDGYSADQSTVKAALDGNPNAKCFIERECKLEDVVIPNKSLKNAIEAFVTRKEFKQTLKSVKEKEDVIIEIEENKFSTSQEIFFAKDVNKESFGSEEEKLTIVKNHNLK